MFLLYYDELYFVFVVISILQRWFAISFFFCHVMDFVSNISFSS